MLKKIFYVLIIIFSFFCLSSNVKALELDSFQNNISYKLDNSDSCPVFGDPADENSTAYFLQSVFNIIKFVGPILCIVLIIIDLVKAVVSQDKDALTKTLKTSAKRIVFALIIFLLPQLINFLFELIGWYGTCGIS